MTVMARFTLAKQIQIRAMQNQDMKHVALYQKVFKCFGQSSCEQPQTQRVCRGGQARKRLFSSPVKHRKMPIKHIISCRKTDVFLSAMPRATLSDSRLKAVSLLSLSASIDVLAIKFCRADFAHPPHRNRARSATTKSHHIHEVRIHGK
jgi:hypothetical protein